MMVLGRPSLLTTVTSLGEELGTGNNILWLGPFSSEGKQGYVFYIRNQMCRSNRSVKSCIDIVGSNTC